MGKRRKLKGLLTTTHGEGRTEEGSRLSRAASACWLEHQNKWRQHRQHSSSLELKIRFWEGVKGANWAKGRRSSTRDYRFMITEVHFRKLQKRLNNIVANIRSTRLRTRQRSKGKC